MKKIFSSIFVLVIVILTTFGVSKAYLHAGFPYTNDGENHLARFANYVLALRERQFPPRFAPNLFNHYGYPVFDFNYPLGNILSVPFSVVHVEYETTFKILVAAAVIFGLMGVFCWLRKFGASRFGAIFGMILFGFNPYLFNLILYRGDIGEILALGVFPWLFWAVEVLREVKPAAQSNQKKMFQRFWLLFLVGLFVTFFLAHNIAAVFGIPFVLLYALLRFGNDIKKWRWFSVILIASFALTLWFWLPALLEKSVTVLDQMSANSELYNHFPTLPQLLFAPLQFGFSYVGNIDSLSFSLGLAQVVSVFVATAFLMKYFAQFFVRKDPVAKTFSNKEVTVAVLMLVSWLLVLFQLQLTQPIWTIFFPITKYLQFPWRLTMFWEVLILPIAAWIFDSLSRNWRLTLSVVLLLQISAFWRLKPVDYFHHDTIDYDFFSQSTSTSNEDRVRAFTFEDLSQWKPAPTALTGSANFTVQIWRGSNRTYTATVTQPATIVEQTMNFLGWQTWVTPLNAPSSKAFQAKYVDSSKIGGRIAYTLPAGTFKVHTVFTEWTPARMIGDGVTLITLLLVILWFTGIPQKIFKVSYRNYLIIITHNFWMKFKALSGDSTGCT